METTRTMTTTKTYTVVIFFFFKQRVLVSSNFFHLQMLWQLLVRRNVFIALCFLSESLFVLMRWLFFCLSYRIAGNCCIFEIQVLFFVCAVLHMKCFVFVSAGRLSLRVWGKQNVYFHFVCLFVTWFCTIWRLTGIF